MRNSFSKRLLAILFAVSMAFCLLSAAAFARGGNAAFSISDDCVAIGEDEDGNMIYYYPTALDAGTESIEFTNLADSMKDGMIASLGNAYVMSTNIAPLNDSYAMEAFKDDWEIEAEYANLDLTGAYCYWIMDDTYAMYFVIVKVDSAVSIKMADCTVIGEYMYGNVYYFDEDLPAAAEALRFADFEAKDVLFISGLSGGLEQETNTALLGDAYKVPANFAGSDSWEPAAGYEDFDFTNCYFYCVYADETASFVVKMPANADKDEEISFKALDGGEELPVSVIKDGYEYCDVMGGGNSTVDLYTVAYSPLGADAITLDFGEKAFAFYGYDENGKYLASYGSLTGQSSVDIADLDYYIWVQTPYSSDFSSGGELQFVVRFKPMFTATVSGGTDVLTEISVEKNGYQYTDYYGAKYLGDLFTLTIPCGVNEIDFAFSDNCLAYNYKGVGQHPVTIDGTDASLFLGGAVDDFIGGAAAYTRKVDINEDGTPDYIQVQNTYNADYSGAELRYAITFRYTFGVSVEDKPMTKISSTENGYTPMNCDPVTGDSVPGTPVALYTVQLPDKTEKVDLVFSESVLPYNYTADGSYLAGEFNAGVTKATVSVDSDGDGKADCIQVQTPYVYDSGTDTWNSTVLYALTFDVGGLEPKPEPVKVTPESLRDNIAAAFALSGAAGDANASWITADMAAYATTFPNTQSVFTDKQKQAIIDGAIAAIDAAKNPSDAAKNIIALASMSINPKQLTTAEGNALNALEKLDTLTFGENWTLTDAANNVYAMPYIMIAYQQFEDCGTQTAALKAAMLANKDGWLNATWGVDAIPPVLLALAPYYGESEVKTALDEGIAAIAVVQLENGAIAGLDGKANASSTGLAMTGLAALGIDPADFQNKKSGKSLADGIITFADDAGSALKPTSNSFATEQGFRGLIALVNAADGAYRIYDFSGNMNARVPATATPARLQVEFKVSPSNASITVTSADKTEIMPAAANKKLFYLDAGTYNYTVAKDGYAVEKGTMTFTAEDVAAAVKKTVSVVLSPERTTARTKTVTITVKVLAHSADTCEGKITYKNNPDKYFSILKNESFTIELAVGDATASEALLAALIENNVKFNSRDNGYFDTIGGYAEMDHGKNSGWMYIVNGAAPQVAACDYKFGGDAVMVWFFTDDCTNDYGSDKWEESHDGDTAATAKADEKRKIEAVISAADIASGEAVTLPVQVRASENAKDAVEISIDIPEDAEKVRVKIPVEDLRAGDVFVLVHEDGTEEVLPKTKRTEDGLVTELTEDVTLKVVHNEKKFEDVSEDDWFAEAVDFVSARRLFVGVSEDEFAPDETMTREMLVAVLYRLEGCPETHAGSTFHDVVSGEWYSNAVVWAAENGIIQGNADSFGTGEPVTREQIAVMMWRLSGKPEAEKTECGASDWAEEAISWAISVGIIQGNETGYSATGTASRAEVAMMVMRFINMQ